MNNMLAEALVHIASDAIKPLPDGSTIVFDMHVRPDNKNFRPGMAMDTLTVSLANRRIDHKGIVDVMVSINFTKVDSKGQILKSDQKELPWAHALHFLRAQLATQKLFDFKQHEPFYTVTRESGRKQTV